ncbi:MAG TPA: EAL domain-containing protein [Acidimicrobiales bacterium]|nr:EAL domain-containing protein [Acidimicrobiales bacterium]
MAALDVVVGRQPIFDRSMVVLGYELLFRTWDAEGYIFARPDGDHMTAEVLFSSVNIGIDRLVGEKRVFCNAHRGLLTGAFPLMLPPERTVIEVLETVDPDEEVVKGCRRLVQQGFTVALDDFRWFEGAEKLLELASIVKLDLQLVSEEQLAQLIERCRQFEVALLAEKVETLDQLTNCQALGFDYFQGYLLSHPKMVPGRALDPGSVARLQLAAKLVQKECTVAELERIVRTDPAMAHQLLQIAGIGAAGGLRRTVRTLREALVLVGWRRLQSWVALLLMTDKGQASEEEMVTALVRARMSEMLAERISPDLSAVAFTAGMLSSLDVLLSVPIEEVLGSLPLDADLKVAALRGDTELGRIVADVADYQLGRADDAVRSGAGEERLQIASLRALTWAVEMTNSMLEPQLV